ncbi:MAG: glycosyl hydrolase [Xanthomonadaceae bacterium]|nr:glycosyl hydrolase [Xanthomonadaceae bacterium]
MHDGKGVPGWLAVLGIVLITALALAATREAHPVPPPPAPVPVTPVAREAILPTVQVWVSTADRRQLLARQPDVPMVPGKPRPGDVVIDPKATYQSIAGFGAAITDASAWLIQNRMDGEQRAALLREIFGPSPGLGMAMTRLTIGASDFSRQPYTLDDLPAGQVDPGLVHFNVSTHLHDLIPTVREALAINPQLRIIASPWSPPAWMKTSDNLIGGQLLPEFEATYADYLVKYVDVLRGYGIPVFALTVQNEPGFEPATYPGMRMSAAVRTSLIGQYLGPALAARRRRVRILEWDHNWDAPDEPLGVLDDPVAAPYVAGVAWHCYAGTPAAQSDVHRAHPDKDAYITECSGGDWASAKKGELLWFARDLLLAGIRNWARGVIYWNLALDENHGPHAGGCDLCKGLVTIDSQTGAVIRNDEYYAFAHFSRFVPPGAVRVGSSEPDKDIVNVAFRLPDDGTLVMVMVNSRADAHTVSVSAGDTGFRYLLPAQSVATFVWQPDPVGSWVRRLKQWMGDLRPLLPQA